jgi:hypothetical protein
VTVLEIFGATYATKTTIGAMIRFFIFGHPKITYTTMIFSKLNPTTNTIISETVREGGGSNCEGK